MLYEIDNRYLSSNEQDYGIMKKMLINTKTIEDVLYTILIFIVFCIVCFVCFYIGGLGASKEFHEFVNNIFFGHIQFIYVYLCCSKSF